MITLIPEIIRALANSGVEFVLVGGVAATVHGSTRLTQDVDIVYRRTPENFRRLTQTLVPLRPSLRGAIAGLPLVFDERTLRNGLNFTLTTTIGDLDLLGEIPGGGSYDALVGSSTETAAFGVRFRVLNLEKLIEVKRAAGRPKDFEAIAELEAILDERDKPGR